MRRCSWCSTHSAEVLLVLTDSLHLRSVQDGHIVGHGLLSLLFVLFLEVTHTHTHRFQDGADSHETFSFFVPRSVSSLPGSRCSSSAERG